MLPHRLSFHPSVGRSIPSDLLRAMPGPWRLRELVGAYVNGNGRCLNVSSEPARCNPTGLERLVQPNGAPRTSNDQHRSTGFTVVSHSPVSRVHARLGRVGRLSSFFSISGPNNP